MTQLATTQKKVMTAAELINSKRDSIAEVVNRCISPEAIIKCGLMAVARDEKLQQCTAQSLIGCMMLSARLALEVNTPLQQAFLIARKNSVKVGDRWEKVMECTFMPGYRGLLTLIYRSRQVENVDAHVVYEGDEFDLSMGSKPYIYHKPNYQADRTDDKIIGAYATCLTKQARRPMFEFIDRVELEKIAKVGQFDDKESPAYKAWKSQMFRKAPIRRGAKFWPLSSESAQSIAEALAAEDGEKVIDVPTDLPALPKPTAALQGVIDSLPTAPVRPGTDAEPPQDADAEPFDVEGVTALMGQQGSLLPPEEPSTVRRKK